MLARKRSLQVVARRNSRAHQRQQERQRGDRAATDSSRHALARPSWSACGSALMPALMRPHRQRQRQDRVLASLRRASSMPRDRARAHHGDAIAHAEDLGQLRRDHQDRQPALGQLLHQRMNLRLGADVHALRRLVENQHRRVRSTASAPARPSAGCRRTASRPGVDRRRLDAQAARRSAAAARARGRDRSGRAARRRRGWPGWCWPRPTSRARRRAAGDPPARRRCRAQWPADGESMRTGAPAHAESRPASAGVSPKSDSASSVRPDPTRPARPTNLAALTVSDTS